MTNLGKLSAAQFFWNEINKKGNDPQKVDTMNEVLAASKWGFTVREGMTFEQFVAQNRNLIQTAALFDEKYNKQFGQLEQPSAPEEEPQDTTTVEQLTEDVKAKKAELPQGPRPGFGANDVVAASSTDEAKKVKELTDKTYNLLEEASNCKDLKIYEYKNGNRKSAILPNGIEISAVYEEGELKSVRVKLDKKRHVNEVVFETDIERIFSDEVDGKLMNITDGYNFDKYKQLAEKIFGKPEEP